MKTAPIVQFASLYLLVVVTGCASNQQDANVKTLKSGFTALDQHNYDAAMTAADQVLANSPNKSLPAEAHYLRGRVFEERAMSNPATLANNLQQARMEYIAAIAAEHTPDLEGRARAGVANVAFHQDDYATALAQWQQAYEKLEKPQDKLLTLYRMGQTAERLGQWSEANKYFATVEQSAPGSDLAIKAHQHAGARGFVVQLATFADAKQAQTAAAAVTRQGFPAQALPDPNNPRQYLLRVSHAGTWQQAQSVKQRFAGTYPNAIILP